MDVLEMSPEAPGGEDTPDGADEIMEQIEETRSQMGETIDAIQDRLSFSNLSEQVSEHVSNAVETAKEAVYDATIGKAATMMKNLPNTNIVRTVKRNPLPFILIGAGAGLLAYQSYSGKRSYDSSRRRSLASAATDTELEQGSLTDTAREKLHGVSDRVSTAAGSAYNKVTGVVDSTYNQAGEMLNKAKARAGEVGTQAYDMYDHYLEENPLAVGAVALALGAAVGFAIPSTRYEAELMGDARNQLMEKAQGHASNLLDQAKQVVTEATQNISQSAGDAIGH
jgi:ElaB/YqjD/DUF883 family membrane-anchored ribosome-binding protein